jgi:hypothetical protein
MKDEMTAGELYDPAMRIDSQHEADLYFEELIQRRMRVDVGALTRYEAANIECENLGYWAGYGSLETRARVERLFGAYHPLLPPADKPQPTKEQLLQLGWNYGKEHGVAAFPWPRRKEGPFE